jgi:uncharacterized protein (DUF2141 family)
MKGSIAVLLVALMALSGTWGCATTTTDVSRTRVKAPGEAAGTVRVAVYDRSSQLAGGIPSARVIHSQLSRVEGKTFVKVYESDESSWTLSDVPAGKYLFSVTSWVDDKGKLHKEPAEEGFRLAPEDKRPNTAVTLGAVGGGALIAAVVYTIVNALSHVQIDLSGLGKTH